MPAFGSLCPMACITLTALLVLSCSFAIADDAPVESGRQALKKTGDYPWYDARQDSVRRVDLRPRNQASSPRRDSSRDPSAGDARPSTARGTPGGGGSEAGPPGSLQSREPRDPVEPLPEIDLNLGWITVLVWIAIAVGLGVLAFFLIRAFLSRENKPTQDAAETEEAGEVDRVEQLPIPVRRTRGSLLDEARAHYESGNFSQAIVYLYSHQLLELDKQQLIHLARGKTNRHYLRELGGRRRLAGLMEQTVVTFEDAFFGDFSISRERFEQCWNRLADFDALVGGSHA